MCKMAELTRHEKINIDTKESAPLNDTIEEHTSNTPGVLIENGMPVGIVKDNGTISRELSIHKDKSKMMYYIANIED